MNSVIPFTKLFNPRVGLEAELAVGVKASTEKHAGFWSRPTDWLCELGQVMWPHSPQLLICETRRANQMASWFLVVLLNEVLFLREHSGTPLSIVPLFVASITHGKL